MQLTTGYGANGVPVRADNDGSSAFRFLLTPIRIVCANTQAAAIARAKASFAIRHTGGARGAISEARTALGLSWRYMEAFENEAAALYAAPMGVAEVREFAAELVKVDQAPSAPARNRRREQASNIVKLFVTSPTVAPLGGTRWAAYNAVTEYVDHLAPVRGARSRAEAAEARALRAVTTGSSAQTMKVDAFRMLQTI